MTTITLEYPIEHGGKTVTEIELCRPKAGHMVRLETALKARGLSIDGDKTASSVALRRHPKITASSWRFWAPGRDGVIPLWVELGGGDV